MMSIEVESIPEKKITVKEQGQNIILEKKEEPVFNEDGTKVKIEQPLVKIIEVEEDKNIITKIEKTKIVQIAQQGPRGPSGGLNEGIDFTAIIGEGGVQAYQTVYVDSEDTVRAANSDNPTHCGRVAGITLESGREGDQVTVRINGNISNLNWDLVPGDFYLVSTGGELTNLTPDVGFYQKVGKALTPTTLIVDLGEPVLIN